MPAMRSWVRIVPVTSSTRRSARGAGIVPASRRTSRLRRTSWSVAAATGAPWFPPTADNSSETHPDDRSCTRPAAAVIVNVDRGGAGRGVYQEGS